MAALAALDAYGRVLALKTYRVRLADQPPVPTLPCLDHEAMLHQRVPPHLAAYLQEHGTGDLHELVVIPATRRIEIDTASTWGEASDASCRRLLAAIATQLPAYRVRVKGPSWWRGERRVAAACRAQVSLRDVLLGSDVPRIRASIERLQTIAALMEKQSRVASWGVRTVTTPLLAAIGIATVMLLGGFSRELGPSGVTWLRYAIVSAIGAAFLYYGLKAVQLTEMSNRVWKRTAEYNLILAERRRIDVER